jgi:hypothetical protein
MCIPFDFYKKFSIFNRPIKNARLNEEDKGKNNGRDWVLYKFI